MYSKTIVSLAILKVNWDKHRKDYVENFIPFIVNLMNKHDYNEIEIERIRSDFEIEYGISLPYHPTITLLNRTRKRGYIKKEDRKYYPVKDKISEKDFKNVSLQQTRKINEILIAFINFAKERYQKIINNESAERILISYLKDFDLDILFASQESTILPDVKISKSNKFLIGRFIRYINQSDVKLFDYIVDISLGHILANTILYREFSKYFGELRDHSYYLDTNIIFELIGTHGTDRKKIYIEFIKELQNSGIKLFLFEHTYNELNTNLEKCLYWIDNPKYDAVKAGKTLNYFVVNGFTSSDIERLIASIPVLLNRLNIIVVDKPDYLEKKKYQIDEDRLREIIIQQYRLSDPFFEEIDKDIVLQNDVDSISSIYRLRQGKKPKIFQEAKHIFLTKNSTLAYVSHLYQREISNEFVINPCLTDTFVGTLIWLQSPAKVYQINQKKIIADAYAALQPDSFLIRRYLNEIKRLLDEDTITSEEYYVLRSHRVALNILEEKTLGDPENFTDTTPEEILYEIKNKLEFESNLRYEEEKEKHNETKEELQLLTSDLESIHIKIDKFSIIVSKILSWTLFISLLAILTYALYLNIVNKPSSTDSNNSLLIIFLSALTLLNLAFGFNLKGIRESFQKKLSNLIIKILQKLFIK